MANRKQRRAAAKRPSRDQEIAQFCKMARNWPDEKLYAECHKKIPITQELIDTCAQEMLEDVIAVLNPHFRAPTREKISTILHNWYDNQDTVNTRQ